jgi:hypothetical protein
MFDYAASGVVYWSAERLRAGLQACCSKEGEGRHVTETCDDEPGCGCPGDGGTGSRGPLLADTSA